MGVAGVCCHARHHRWPIAGTLLASCSDDGSAKIWRVDSAAPVHDFTAHSKEIFTINWSPTGVAPLSGRALLILLARGQPR